ncbi:10362_t:CDS:1 [Funneliformis caledonium]|uniref:10362_t:CDS:1 n=1 Tax=Funneliformis caledonium TaxID=1117310 RepID=A0A9N9N3V9_9GLOM|nr:10362_t:CDS:1 [Funneliformis caledonium]
MSTPGSASKLDEHSGASPQQTFHSSERVVEDQSQKNNSLFRSYIPRTTRQSSPGQDSTENRLASFPERPERELYGNDFLDSPSKAWAQYSDQYAHNQCANETNDATLSKFSNLSDYICEHLDKNNRFGFHQITNGDSLDFVDVEYIEYLNEKFGIIDIKSIFVDRSGLVNWLLDKDGNMYEWNEMEQNLLYMGKNLVDGLTNYFIYPENICQVMNNDDRVPVMVV